METHLGTFGVSAHPACARLTNALRFAEQIEQLLKANLDMPAAHVAWSLTHGSLAKALDSDLRILPPERSAPLAQVLTEELVSTLEAII